MTISKRNSRAININDENFRWTICPGSGYLVFVAEHATVKGQKIEVYIESEINKLWMDFPYVEDMNLRLVQPNGVRKIIIKAITLGWNYKEPGKPIVFDLKNENLVQRQN